MNTEIKLYTLKNQSGTAIKITNYGAIITSILTADRNENLADIALGYHTADDYINAAENPYFGAMIGRCGNRIAGATFCLDGTTYNLAANNGGNHLHGGRIGYDQVIWTVDEVSDYRLQLSYLSKDGEEGYPGNFNITLTYTLTEDNELKIDYFATTDKSTPVNLTNHSYFNLKGEGEGDILDHELMINAIAFTPVVEGQIPTGEITPVAGTPFDFTTAKTIGRDIDQSDQQLECGGGYDQNWVLNKDGKEGAMTLAATVYEPTSGRVMDVFTNEPGMQFYSGNSLGGNLTGKSGKTYERRSGFCLETQHYPDSPNQPAFPSIILTPDAEYKTTTIYKFSTK